MTIKILVATAATRNGLNLLHFDAESIPIRIDNCCSRCITNDVRDLVPSTIKTTTKVVRGFKGEECAATCRGTLRWAWDDDLGVETIFLIPNSYYVPEAVSKLLCPQHWAQEAADHSPIQHGTGCDTNDTCVTLYWRQRSKQRTVPLDPSINVGILHSTTGYRTSDAKCAMLEATMTRYGALCCHDLGIVSDDDDSLSDSWEEPEVAPPPLQEGTTNAPSTTAAAEGEPHLIEFDLQGPQEEDLVPVDIDEEEQVGEPASAAMLREHHRLSHLPFSRMRSMARAGVLPGTFATCREPLCTACMYGKATRRPWRTKATEQGGLKRATYAGQCVAVDQSESPVPGLVAQLKGIPTKKRYTCATVFVDLYSDYSYVHFQYSTNAQDTLEAKHAFERFAKSHGVQVHNYLADNGRFAEHAWKNDANALGQSIRFAGVNAHFQNGRAEKKIRDLQDMAQTQLIHARRRWPDAISSYLWPYAMRSACSALNMAALATQSVSPTERFSNVPISPNPKDSHVFGCPAYVLDNRMQAGCKIPKWEERA